VSYLTRIPPLGIFKLVEGAGAATYSLGLNLFVGATMGESQEMASWPGCPLNGVVTQAQAELWWGIPGAEGFHLSAAISIRRPGTTSPIAFNGASQEYGIANYFPLDLSYNCQHYTESDALPVCHNRWGYVMFENMPYWQDKPVQVELINFAPNLFDPALGNGVQIWCADTPGTVEPTERTDVGYSTLLYNFGSPPDEHTNFTGDPPMVHQRQTLLLHGMGPGDFPLTIAVPAGRALIICTGNQDPQTTPLGTNVFNDVAVGFANPDPAGAYRNFRSNEPTNSGNLWTVSAANQLRIRGLIWETLVGGAFDYNQGILVYRDPAQLAGNTLRVPITSPFLWYIEDPDDTYFGGVINATLRAYAVDESELIGTSEENFNIVKSWLWADLQARLGSVLTERTLTTSDENTFSAGSGNMDVDLTGGRQLVWYVITALSAPAYPTAGLHAPAINHTNPSIF